MPTKNTPDLPMRNGITASRCFLPKGNWLTMLDFLVETFSHVSRDEWVERLQFGYVTTQENHAITPETAYEANQFIFYYRHVDNEPAIPFIEEILFQDEHVLVVDKPHFIPVIPAGRYLNETLLVRLKKSLQMPDLTPLHRIDRETAGLVLFSTNIHTRGSYQQLFEQRLMHKTYEAIAPTLNLVFPFTYCSRLEKGTPFFRMKSVDGDANCETKIDIIESRGELTRYELKPVTGKQHQLRVQMATLGAAILNDTIYPTYQPVAIDDFANPLQLLAKAIAFNDPLTGVMREFTSNLTLQAL